MYILLASITTPSQSSLFPIIYSDVYIISGQGQVLLKPKTTEEVSKIVKYCQDHNIAICPQGGNTGLVGGSVPVFDEVIVNTQLMNKIISLDPLSGRHNKNGCQF